MASDVNSGRVRALQLIVVAIFSLLLWRVFYLQMVETHYGGLSERNIVRREQIYAARGEVLDRNGNYVVQSRGCYDMMVVYRDLDRKGFDTVAVCEVLSITRERLERQLSNARMRSRAPFLVTNFVSMRDKLRFDELNIAGFIPIYRTVRQYPRSIGGNLLGHVGEVNEAQLRRNPEYSPGDYIGVGGVESAYESDLRGEKGVRRVEIDTYGVVQRSHMDGAFDTLAVQGRRLTSTIDARLQLFGEELMVGKVGAAVAIEPSTGEILMMVSSPSFDPDKLVGRQRGNNYMELLNNPRNPLFNRAVSSRYPPGSIFKLLQGLIGLQDGVLTPSQVYECYGSFQYGTKELKCHSHKPHTDLVYAVATSCNPYFCNVFCSILDNRSKGDINEAYTSWRDEVLSFGFGRKLDSDFLSEGSGYVPEASYYNRIYRGSWNPLTVISLSIGQGELGCTPLQMANLAAIIANRGYYYIPHIIKEVQGQDSLDSRFYERQYTSVEARHFEPIIQGMWDGVNVEGSSTLARINGLDVCGKTGTAQNPHGEDHSTFLSFAPRNDPKIAISVYVENGGWGASSALPIASLIEELYLTDTIRRQWLVDYIKNKKIDYPVYDVKLLDSLGI
ncbi:MAG: penicillin-binding transpeptidase domain-containing protein [Rikenellaceae bacterium]